MHAFSNEKFGSHEVHDAHADNGASKVPPKASALPHKASVKASVQNKPLNIHNELQSPCFSRGEQTIDTAQPSIT